MAETALQMIDMSQRHSLNVLESINRSMTNSLELKSREGQITADVYQNALQFAEEKRFNDARIIGITNENNLRAKEFELEQTLAPLKHQTALLQLEASKFDFEKKKMAVDDGIFKSFTGEYDELMGAKFLSTRNPDQLKAYIELKNKYRDNTTIKGKPFDRESWERDIDAIDIAYKHSAPIETYSDETAALFERVSPAARKEYERRYNPTIIKSRNGLAVSYLSANPKDKADFMDKYTNLYNGEETGFLGIAGDIYEKNSRQIERNNMEASRIRVAANAARMTPGADTAEAEKILAQAALLDEQSDELNKTNRELFTRIGQGKFSFDAPVAEKVLPAKKGFEFEEATKTAAKPVLNIDPKEDGALYRNVYKTAAIFNEKDPGTQEGELADIDFNWLSKNSTKGPLDITTLKSIKSRIEGQLDALEETGSTVKDRFNSDKGKKLFETIDRETEVPISGYLAKLIDNNVPHEVRVGLFGTGRVLGEYVGDSMGEGGPNTKKPQKFITFGKGIHTDAIGKADGIKDVKEFTVRALGQAGGLSSYESIQKLLKYIPNKDDREEARKELYISLITASLSNAANER